VNPVRAAFFSFHTLYFSISIFALARHIVRHEICYLPQTILPRSPNTLPFGQRLFFGKQGFPNEARSKSISVILRAHSNLTCGKNIGNASNASPQQIMSVVRSQGKLNVVLELRSSGPCAMYMLQNPHTLILHTTYCTL